MRVKKKIFELKKDLNPFWIFFYFFPVHPRFKYYLGKGVINVATAKFASSFLWWLVGSTASAKT